ncbi:glutamine synthetase 2 cytoplasmic-like isoform X2 [Phymastichus coffea]|nr:glutamine synthetase 2 cytoplasmic-like isoform X2 [Phymastichus coffea]
MDCAFEDFRRVSKVSLPPSEQILWNSLINKQTSRADYVWIDDAKIIRSKIMIISGSIQGISELPLEEYSSKYTLRPVSLFDNIDPNENHVLVLCEMADLHLAKPSYKENKRQAYKKIILSDKVVTMDLLFEIEQEFTFKECVDMLDFHISKCHAIIEAFGKSCVNALIPICSITYKSSHNECWSYKIGPCTGRQAADMLWVSRFIISRISQELDMTITFEPLNTVASGEYPAEEYRPSTKYRFSSGNMRDRAKTAIYMETCYSKFLKYSEYDQKSLEDVYGRGCLYSLDLIRICHSAGKRVYIEDGRPSGYSDPYDVISYIIKKCFL